MEALHQLRKIFTALRHFASCTLRCVLAVAQVAFGALPVVLVHQLGKGIESWRGSSSSCGGGCGGGRAKVDSGDRLGCCGGRRIRFALHLVNTKREQQECDEGIMNLFPVKRKKEMLTLVLLTFRQMPFERCLFYHWTVHPRRLQLQRSPL